MIRIILALTLALYVSTANASVTIKTEPSIFANISIINADTIKEMIAERLSEKLEHERLTVKLYGHEKGVQLNSKHESFDVEITNFSVDQNSRRFKSNILFTYADRSEAKEINGSYEEIVSIPTLSSRMSHDVLITRHDIDYMDMPKHKLRHDTVTDPKQIIGKILKRNMQAMRPIRRRNLEREELISRSSTIKLIYETNSIRLQTAGIAMDSGAKGDLIRVRNANSNKIIQAVVKDRNIVIASAGSL